MKQTIFFIAFILILISLNFSFAQQQEGLITYEVKMKMPTMPGGPGDQGGAKYMTNQDQLFFNANESLFVPEPNEEQDFDNGEGVQIRIVTPQNEYYFNTSDYSKIAQMEFMGKKYLVTDSIRIKPWKIGSETKIILGYTCKIATWSNEAKHMDVVAWFTDKLRPFLGPEEFNTLPGTVLEVHLDNGMRILTTENIEFRLLKKGELKAPKGGTPMNGPEFDKMVKKQVEEMEKSGDHIYINH